MNTAFVARHDYVRVDIGFCYGSNSNNAYFTGLGLYKEEYGTSFAYDDKGNVVKVTDQAKKNSSFEYDTADNLKKLMDPKGNAFKYDYDKKHRVTGAASAAGMKYTFVYDDYGNPVTARTVDPSVETDAKKAMTSKAAYTTGTAEGQYMASQTSPEGSVVTYEWDTARGQMNSTTDAAGNKVSYTYDTVGRLSSVSGKRAIRGSEKEVSGKHTTVFQYMKAPDGGETGRVASIKNGSDAISYGYDKRGYVTSATNGSTAWKYHYDASGQLIREENPVQQKTFVYQYDEGGNLLEVKSYTMTDSAEPEGSGTVEKTFTYGSTWKDQLAAVTMDGKTRTFTYDAKGNMLSDGKYTYSWTKGNLLEKVTGDGLEAAYTYDASGIRTSKKVNGTTTEYLTAGGSVLGEKKNGVWQYYLYDGDGQLSAISYKGSDYYYIRDNLRTITGLVDANGVAVVNYRYDSWGRMLDITGSMAESLGKDNPYRYKGYCYDEETGMYYLKSRYYAPEICRFISADDISAMLDSPMSLWDKNLYVYCDNDPVNKKDDDGEIADFVVMGIIGAVANVGISFITATATGQDYSWKNVILDAVAGALTAIPVTSRWKMARDVAKETLGDFAIYTFVNTIPYELINSLAYAVGDTILTSNTNNKRSSGSTKKSTGTNRGSNNNSKKTPAPPSSRKGNIRPLTPMNPIINSWNFKNNNFHAW